MRSWVAAWLSLVLAAPLALLAWLLLAPEPGLEPAEPEPVWVAAVQREERETFQARLQVTFGEPAVIAYRGAPGTVTAVHLEPGAPVRAGDPVVEVDGLARLAYHGDVPFHRDLARNDRGPDVAALQRYLALLGEDVADDGRYGWATVAAVARLAERVGVERPDGSFDRGWVVWIPAGEVRIATLSARLADPLGPGEEIAEVAPPLASVELMHLSQDPLELPHGGPWELLLTDGAPAGEFADPGDIAALPAVAGAAERAREHTAAAATLDVVVREATAATVVAVPSGAVHVRADGRACVVRESPGGGVATDVTLGERGAFGDVAVTGGIEPGDRVLLGPAEGAGERCG